VRSSESGRVLRRLNESEGVVAMGTPLMEIGDPSLIEVVIDLLSREAAAKIAALGHGYQVDGTIILWQGQDVLRVPVGALFRGEQGDWQVFVDDGGRARARRQDRPYQ